MKAKAMFQSVVKGRVPDPELQLKRSAVRRCQSPEVSDVDVKKANPRETAEEELNHREELSGHGRTQMQIRSPRMNPPGDRAASERLNGLLRT